MPAHTPDRPVHIQPGMIGVRADGAAVLAGNVHGEYADARDGGLIATRSERDDTADSSSSA